eukprot:1527885-Prymnesium_polylepis.1
MASRGLWSAGAGKVSEEGSRELCDAKIAWRPPISMRFSTRRSSGLLAQCVMQRRRCKAGGQRRAGEHDAEHRRRPPRRLSGAILRHW